MKNNVPNLDCAWPEELMAFWKKHHTKGHNLAALLFPDRPKGYTRVARDLANYASNKATAMDLRTQGRIQRALYYEGICETIYSKLPDWAKW